MADAGARNWFARVRSEVLAHDASALNWGRGVLALDVMFVPLVFFWSYGYEQYLLSAVFGALLGLLADPGGPYGRRVLRMAGFGLAGAGLTAAGFALGGQAWGWLVLATFVVTLLCSMAVVLGVHAFVAGLLLNIWFIIAIGVEFSLHQQTRVHSYVWGQVLAWVGGSALWIVVTFVVWLIRGRDESPQPVAEVPSDRTPRKLSTPIVALSLIRALGLAGAVALAFGANLPHGTWLPIATAIAMRPAIEQSTVLATQRLLGALLGAVAAGLLLLIPANEHGTRLLVISLGLQTVALVLLMHAAAIRFFNYALYTAAIAAAVLTLEDLTQPSNYSAEGYRVLWTLVGVAIGVAVMLLAGLLAKRGKAKSQLAIQSPST
jgi:uncharacterized membrane protein YccC